MMLRQGVRPWHRMSVCQHQLCRQASTSTYPPLQQQQQPEQQQDQVEPLPAPTKPPSPAWYTGRPALNSLVESLQATVNTTRSSLYREGYLKSVSQDYRTLTLGAKAIQDRNATGARWLEARDMATKIGTTKVRLSYYRQIISLLNELQALLPYLQQEGRGESITKLVQEYTRPHHNDLTASLLSPEQVAELTAKRLNKIGGRETNRGFGYLDQDTGISYAIGKKKTATAKAWILPVPLTSTPEAQEGEQSESLSSTSESEPPLGQILINKKALSAYFPLAAERSIIVRPFTLTENLGKYNVFVLVQGSGISSQAQAVSVACARALAARDLSEEQITRKILNKGERQLLHLSCIRHADIELGANFCSISRHAAKRSKSGREEEDRKA